MKNTIKFISALLLASPLFFGTQAQAQCMTLDIHLSDYNGSPISCHGAADGSISIIPLGNIGNVTYTWSNGANSSSINGLTAGTYTLTAIDALGCTVSKGITLSEPTPITFTTTSITTPFGYHLKCNGDANARFMSLASGGTDKILYNWSSGHLVAWADDLSAGTYTITATDINGCVATNSITVTEPPVVTANASVLSHVSIAGANDGQAIANGNGGSGALSYDWSNGANSAQINNLAAGTYTVTVTDYYSCAQTATVVINNPTNFTVGGGVSGNPSVVSFNNTAANNNASRPVNPGVVLRPQMPQGISPNGDGLNDQFIVKNIENYEDNTLIIYDINGQEVNRFENYRNDWSGQASNHNELPAGTYISVLRYNDNGKQESISTQVQIRR
jgi:gliding motility-associated-like protein